MNGHCILLVPGSRFCLAVIMPGRNHACCQLELLWGPHQMLHPVSFNLVQAFLTALPLQPAQFALSHVL